MIPEDSFDKALRASCGILIRYHTERAIMPWFAIRTVYHFGQKLDGTNIFEERVVAFEADNRDLAFEKGEAEAHEYAKVTKVVAYPDWHSYQLDPIPMADGQEVWSAMFEAALTLKDFYEARYCAYDYDPDPP
jgi:hypothetical protein